MKKAFRILNIFLCLVTLVTAFTGCNAGGDNDFVIPSDLLSEEEYRAEVKKLSEGENLVDADTAAIDKLGNRLRDMIVYSTNDITDTAGTTYYVSNDGNDENDGKTPKTAWATLSKVNVTKFRKDDLVLFERGGLWRGYIDAQSDVTYSAYGEGPKPKIYSSIDGMEGEWTLTDKADIYVYSEKLYESDIGVIVFDSDAPDAKYANKKANIYKIVNDLDFAFQGAKATSGKKDGKLYIKCKEGNPKDVFKSIEISRYTPSVKIANKSKNIHIDNLEFMFGTNPIIGSGYDNIKMTYCVAGWHGGHMNDGNIRLFGGVAVAPDGDHIYVEHCYLYQQFDSGVTPQVSWATKEPSVFDTFVTSDCLFEYCEYTLEYFSTQLNTDQNCIKNMYFGYNFCRYGGYGFGDKANASAYVKSWSHENNCYDSTIEYNIFDRPTALSVEIMATKQREEGSKKEFIFDLLPKMQNNIYIHRKDRKFANVNNVTYNFNEQTYNTLKGMGFETGARYLFAPETNK